MGTDLSWKDQLNEVKRKIKRSGEIYFLEKDRKGSTAAQVSQGIGYALPTATLTVLCHSALE